MIGRLFVLLLSLLGGHAYAEERLAFATALPMPPLTDLVVRGTNDTAGPQQLVVRIDDMPGPDYAHRVNEERYVPPGPFLLRLRLASLRTPRGRALDLPSLVQALAFAPQGGLRFLPMELDQPGAMPPGTFGWFFGGDGAAPLAGLRTVEVADSAVSGPLLKLVHRPSTDPVLAWGMRLTRFEGDLPPGAWHLTLWTEDPGEWETLPPVYQRRIRLNGRDIVYEQRSEAEWVDQRYLAGRTREADPRQPPYQSLGAVRGGRVEADVDLPDGHFVLELAGHPQAATHVSLLTASPAGQPSLAADAIDAVRAARFAEAWPVIGPPHLVQAPPKALTIDGDTAATAAPGGLAIFRMAAHAPVNESALAAVDGALPGTRLLWGLWRWRRPAPDTPGLVYSAAHLRADSERIPLRADLPRPLTLLVPVPDHAQPGTRRLSVVLVTDRAMVEHRLTLTVLPVKRPPPAARVGVFLDNAPQLSFDPAAAHRQAGCDMDTLQGLGFTAVSPPIATPGADMAPFLADLAAAASRFAPPVLAYSAARRLEGDFGDDAAGAMVARANAAAEAAGMPPPVWTVADEPTGSGTAELATGLARTIRKAAPHAALAAHLNDPADTKLLPDYDLITVNPRYGADAADIARLRAAGHRPWLYNMPRLRIAAGFYLWRIGADGLMQWHARMPTADAFDPTDGREGDVQFLWPTPGVCAPADLDADGLELAEGQEDLRWIAWLDAAAHAKAAGAADLLARLRTEVPDTWAAAAALPADASAQWRQRILRLAQGPH